MKSYRLVLLVLFVFVLALPAAQDDSMRRKKPIAVKVKAPSRGLVTRWPSETADRMNPSSMLGVSPDSQRVCTVAQNVRFEDGVIAAAPGYKRITLSTSLLTNIVAHWKLDEATGTRRDSLGTNHLLEVDVPGLAMPAPGQAAGKIGKCLYSGSPALASPYVLSNPSSDFNLSGASFTWTGWIKLDSAMIANGQGLLVEGSSFGIVSQANQVFFFVVDSTATSPPLNFADPHVHKVTSSVALAADTWYFVAAVYDGANLTIRVNATVTTTAYASGIWNNTGTLSVGYGSLGFLYVDSLSFWRRALSNGELTTVHNTPNGLDFPFFGGACNALHEGNLIGNETRPFVFTCAGNIFYCTRTYVSNAYVLAPASRYAGTTPTTGYDWRITDFYDKVVFAQKDNAPQYLKPADSATVALPGIPVSSTNLYTATSNGNDKWEGVESFAGHTLLWKLDQLLWSDLNDFGNYIPVPATIQSSTFTTDASFVQPAVGSTVSLTMVSSTAIATLTAGQYVRVIYTTGGIDYYNYYAFVSTSGATQMTVKLLGTTGRTASGDTIATTQTMTTLDANEAGAAQIVGSNANGPIYRVWSVADYAYIFKEWSIQSLQYVGQQSGTFALRTEVTREGLLSRNSGVNLGNGSIVFLGHRELYTYQGGPTPTPVCQQYTRQLFEELDRSQIDSIQVFHRERRNEIWVVYPIVGGTKVLIWNYTENTASLDDYGSVSLLRGIRVGWPVDPSWDSLSVLQVWSDFSDATSWDGLVSGGNEENFIVADSTGTFWIHGAVYDRGGDAYTALAETMDYDFNDGTQFKYVDVVHVGIQVKAQDNATRTLYVQVGGRTSLDGDITWSAAQAISVQGSANFTTKVNPGGSGRYIRLRFYSSDVDVQWRVSSYEIFCRPGGTY